MIDHVRSEIARRDRETSATDDMPLVVAPALFGEADIDPEDTLVLLFMCCHPSLTIASAIVLTLRAVGGLTTAEIAKAFMVPEATIAQRISRAKQTIKTSGVPFSMPDAEERAQRLTVVLHVLYLIFSEGYTASSGETLQRADLADEAIRLTRQVRQLLPGEVEVMGLLALMLLTDARRGARCGSNGELIPLDEQERTLWDREAIAEGVEIISSALAAGNPGEYQIQAAIAAVHDEAQRYQDTDWAQILALYSVLKTLTNNPMVAVNFAVAAAMVHGPQAGLDLLAPLETDERLRAGHRLDTVHAHLLERAGDLVAAEQLYRAAALKTTSVPERNYLAMKAARLRSGFTQDPV
jgi:predicted RNA polymerase sigma factor